MEDSRAYVPKHYTSHKSCKYWYTLCENNSVGLSPPESLRMADIHNNVSEYYVEVGRTTALSRVALLNCLLLVP